MAKHRPNRGREVTRIETFVDAAFAFAVTLLVISFDAIPDSAQALVQALKGVPAFAASFALLAMLWWALRITSACSSTGSASAGCRRT
ncbi:MAG: TMEM175 family protein [Pseudomonadota bacterium]|nr:TMEM175 family protein [Pseudomonadota bacterium]